LLALLYGLGIEHRLCLVLKLQQRLQPRLLKLSLVILHWYEAWLLHDQWLLLESPRVLAIKLLLHELWLLRVICWVVSAFKRIFIERRILSFLYLIFFCVSVSSRLLCRFLILYYLKDFSNLAQDFILLL